VIEAAHDIRQERNAPVDNDKFTDQSVNLTIAL